MFDRITAIAVSQHTQEPEASVSHDRVVLGQHLVTQPEVEVVSVLVLGDAAQSERDGDGPSLAVVDRGPPGGAAPRAAYPGPLPLPQLHLTVRAASGQEGGEPAEGEALERHLG